MLAPPEFALALVTVASYVETMVNVIDVIWLHPSRFRPLEDGPVLLADTPAFKEWEARVEVWNFYLRLGHRAQGSG